MKLQLNGIEIEIPTNAKVDVSEDGKRVCIGLPEPEVLEKIRVIEKIRVVEVPGPETNRYVKCQHYPSYPYDWRRVAV